MTNHRIGDRPQFPLSNQRFDKGDANNIAVYYEQIISRFVGSIYGQAWGCMSNPQFEVTTLTSPVPPTVLPVIRPKRCVLLYSIPEDGTLNTTSEDKGPWGASIVLFDPARAGQPLQSLPTLSSFVAGHRPWILFRRQETDTNVGNKAYWDTGSNTEEIGAAPLQRSEWVEFKLSVSYSSSDRAAGWYRCAYIDSWGGTPGSAATPVIKPIHWMDSQYYKDDVPPPTAMPVASALVPPNNLAAAGAFGFNPLTEMPELAKLLHWMAGKLGQHYSTTSTLQVTEGNQATFGLKPGAFVSNLNAAGGWLSTPPRGLIELDNDLADVESALPAAITSLQNADIALDTGLNSFINSVRRTPRLFHSMYVTQTGSNQYDVRLGTTVVEPDSLSPRLLTAVGIPDLSNPDYSGIFYLFQDGERSGSQKKVLLTLICFQKTGSPSYEITAVDVVAHSPEGAAISTQTGTTVTQRYYSDSTASVPPSQYVKIEFVVQDPNPNPLVPVIDLSRPFTVYIYGRNV